jgi:exonuclease SbcD
MTIKFIHFSDAHIGADSVGPIDVATRISGRVLDYLDMLDAIVDFAKQEDVDAAFFTGDLFHTNDPSPTYLNEASKRIVRLAGICPVIMLVGNHDMSRLDKPSSVEVYNTLNVPNIHIGNNYELLDIETKSGLITVGTLPYPTRQILGDDIRNRPVEKTKELIKKRIAAIVKDMVAHVSEGIPNVLLGHFTVVNAMIGEEHNMSMFNDTDIALEDLVDPCWSYIGLGHIHKFQCLFEDPPVVYAGSIERVSFNEEMEAKGFIYGTIEGTDAAKWEFIQLDSRPYVTLSKVITEGDPTKKVLALLAKRDVKAAVVRIMIKLPAEMRHMLDVSVIQEAVMAAGAYCVASCHVDARQESVERISSETFHPGMTPMELLKVYLKEAINKDDDEIASLVSMAVPFMSDDAYDEVISNKEEPEKVSGYRQVRRRE